MRAKYRIIIKQDSYYIQWKGLFLWHDFSCSRINPHTLDSSAFYKTEKEAIDVLQNFIKNSNIKNKKYVRNYDINGEEINS